MIRRLRKEEASAAGALWLEANLDAHGFIPAAYWQGHFPEVREQLAQAEVWVYEEAGRILGFIGLTGDCVAGLFVRREARSQGVGRALLDHGKALRPRLTLRVYRKNPRAEAFYRREGFVEEAASVDGDTGEEEAVLVWRR